MIGILIQKQDLHKFAYALGLLVGMGITAFAMFYVVFCTSVLTYISQWSYQVSSDSAADALFLTYMLGLVLVLGSVVVYLQFISYIGTHIKGWLE